MPVVAEMATNTSSPGDSATPLVSLQGVSKAYANGTVALRNLSFTAQQGEFVSLIGPSGCGKSTALRNWHESAVQLEN